MFSLREPARAATDGAIEMYQWHFARGPVSFRHEEEQHGKQQLQEQVECIAMTREYSYRYLRFVISELPGTRLFVAEASWHGVPLSVTASSYDELLEAIRAEVDALRGDGRELLRSYGQWPAAGGPTGPVDDTDDD